MRENENTTGGAFLSFLAGAVVGAGLALLSTPKRGKEVRQELSGFTEDAMARFRTYAHEAQGKFNALLEEGREQMRDQAAESSMHREREEAGYKQGQREGVDTSPII